MSKELKSIDIKGKAYSLINERVKYFKENVPDGVIRTELLNFNADMALFKAEIIVNGTVVSNGHAFEEKNSSFINKTSYIENAETSAIGRALAFYGIGIDASIASYDEVANAILNQNKNKAIPEIKELSEKETKEIEAKAETKKAENETLLTKFKGLILNAKTLTDLESVAKEIQTQNFSPEIKLILKTQYTEKQNKLKEKEL